MTHAHKQDAAKQMGFSLIPRGPLHELAKVYAIGAEKYGPHNWRTGMSFNRIYDAMVRHQTAWLDGEAHDPDDGQHHLASVAWCALALIEYEQTHPERDDRWTAE